MTDTGKDTQDTRLPIDHESVNTWMRGNGWEHLATELTGGMQYWYKKGFPNVDQDLAAEMWRMSEGRVIELITKAFKNSTNQNIDGDAKYWSESGEYNSDAMGKFFPQNWFDDKFMPALKEAMKHE